MCIFIRSSWLGFQESGWFAQMVCLQLLFKWFVSSLGEQWFFFKDRENAHLQKFTVNFDMDGWETYRSFKHINALLKIHAKVHHCPINTLLHVLLLLQHKHVMVEELLQFLNIHSLSSQICWRSKFTSLQKLMQSCSNPLKSKISKPAMSRTPMKEILFISGLTSVSLHRSTRWRNSFSNRARAIADT